MGMGSTIESICRDVWNAFLKDEGLIVTSFQYLDVDPVIGPEEYRAGDPCPNIRLLCDFSDGSNAKIRLLQDEVIGDDWDDGDTCELGSSDDYESFKDLFDRFLCKGGRISDCMLCISSDKATPAQSGLELEDLSGINLVRRFRSTQKDHLLIVISMGLGYCGSHGIFENIPNPDLDEAELSAFIASNSDWSQEVVKAFTLFCSQLTDSIRDLEVEDPENLEVLINNKRAQEYDFFGSSNLYQGRDDVFSIGDASWLPISELMRLISSETDYRTNFLRTVGSCELEGILFRATSQSSFISGPMGLEFSASVDKHMEIFQCSAVDSKKSICLRQGFDCGEFDTGAFTDEASSEYIYKLATLNGTIWQGTAPKAS